jgi:hypothetical protein
MTLDDCRKFHAEEIRYAGKVSSPALLAALAGLPREKFLGPGARCPTVWLSRLSCKSEVCYTPRLKIVNKISRLEKKEPPRLTAMGRNGYFTSVGKKVGEVSK